MKTTKIKAYEYHAKSTQDRVTLAMNGTTFVIHLEAGTINITLIKEGGARCYRPGRTSIFRGAICFITQLILFE